MCCCCPCAVVNILLLAVYKVPAELCKKAIRRRKRRRLLKMKNKMMMQQNNNNYNSGSNSMKDINVRGMLTLEECLSEEMKAYVAAEGRSSEEVEELEREMWALFQETGFWRSSSRRQGSL